MNTQKITLGDVWEDVTKTRKMTNRIKDRDNIVCRMTKTKSGAIKMVIQIGMEICDLLKWKKGDRIRIMKNKVNGTFLKIISCADNGYTLYEPNAKPCRLNVNCTFDFHKKYVLSHTKIVSFDMDKNSIVIDLSSLINE
jgi:hypothetical protein